MKALAIILSIYIILLSAIPCCIFDNCPDDKSVSTQSENNNHESGDEDGCGTCSPFYNCSTCNASFIYTQLTDFICVDFIISDKIISNYVFISIGTCLSSIWQPPKLA